MKIISWNVGGFRACLKKGFEEFFNEENADIFCIQESKVTLEELTFHPEGYEIYLNPADKKGYSGTLVYTKVKPIEVSYGMNKEIHDHEGRIITLEYEAFYLICVYVPNSKKELIRLDYRMTWEDDFRKYVNELKKKKSVIICGDMNVAHKEIDIKNPKQNEKNAGFTLEEREKFTELLDSGFIDTYRLFYPNEVKYTWWSYLFKARERNAGWRIDYFLVSNDLKERLKDATIYTEVLGSDHCPIGLVL